MGKKSSQRHLVLSSLGILGVSLILNKENTMKVLKWEFKGGGKGKNGCKSSEWVTSNRGWAGYFHA